MVLCNDQNLPASLTIQKGELFCGGFSGWTQASIFLNETTVPISSVFAIDKHHEAIRTFARSYAKGDYVRNADEAIHVASTKFDVEHDSLMIHGDVLEGWWVQFVPILDVLAMSPPCPSWSQAHVAYGLMREDGFLTIEAMLKATLLRPKVIAFENVAGMPQHPHYQILLEVFAWLGWQVTWKAKIDLEEVLPHQRERFLLTLLRSDIDGKPSFQFQHWSRKQGLSFESCDILRARDCLSHGHVPPMTSDILRTYLHPRFVPGNSQDTPKGAKAFRLKRPDQSCSCILAHYGFDAFAWQ